jgi:hypothetical protein
MSIRPIGRSLASISPADESGAVDLVRLVLIGRPPPLR